MNSIASFFGTHADQVLALDRQTAANLQAAEQLAEHLEQLHHEREILQQHDEEIRQLTVQLERIDAQLQEAREQVARLNFRRDRLARTLGSFWGRVGIRLRYWFTSGAPGVEEVRDLLQSVSREAQQAENAADAVAETRTGEAARLRCLTIPQESVQYAIGFLEQLRQSVLDQARTDRAAVDDEIRAAVRSTDLPLLRNKLATLPNEVDRVALTACILRLKSLLHGLDAQPEGDAPLADLGGDAAHRLADALRQGFTPAAGRGTAQVAFRGTGRKHVRRTRTHTSLHGDRNVRSHHRGGTQWRQVPVQLSGQLPLQVEIRFPRWQPARLVDALRHEALASFRCGADRVEETGPGEEATIGGEIDELVRQIREILGLV